MLRGVLINRIPGLHRPGLIGIWLRLVCLLALQSISTQSLADGLDNQLKDHPAPYLALHANDPVHWQQWNQQTVAYARKNNKILMLSVGYFACHWCHVMQRESFQDAAIAKFLNTHFVPVKIDRELEPALDQRLLSFAQRTIGRGGWPLNAFVTPEGFPIHVVMYARPKSFLRSIRQLHSIWSVDAEKVRSLIQADQHTVQFSAGSPVLDKPRVRRLIEQSVSTVMQGVDELDGGFGEGPSKFPSFPQLSFLLESYRESGDETIGEFLKLTLDAMQWRGLHDHLDGGFFRYTVDPQWQTPHFEKMLLDNAQLASLFWQAATVFSSDAYREIAVRTLDFMQKKMQLASGAMAASLSSVDDAGIEGGAYLWRRQQVRQLLTPDEFKMATALWGLDSAPTLEHGHHLSFRTMPDEYAITTHQSLGAVNTMLRSILRKLARHRSQRTLPVDNKAIAGWNGLALNAFAQAAASPGYERYRETAAALHTFIATKLWHRKDQRLHRAIANQQAWGRASLEDYAYVGQGLFSWAKLTGKPADWQLTDRVIAQGWKSFYRNNAWLSDPDGLLAPGSADAIVPDGPGSSPAAILISLTLARSTQLGGDWRSRAIGALNVGFAQVEKLPYWFVTQLSVLRAALNR